MAQIGELLTRIREKKDLSLREVEQATKIRINYLEALEQEDFGQLPGQVYVIGFLRTYSRFLGLDPELIVNEYKEQVQLQKEVEQPDQPIHFEPGKRKMRLLPFAVVLTAILVVAVMAWSLLHIAQPVVPADGSAPNQDNVTGNDNNADRPDTPAEQSTGGQVSQSPLEKDDESTEQGNENRPPETVAAEVSVSGSSCWIRVIADGKEIFSGTLAAGAVQEFTAAQEMRIRFGNAQAAAVTLNGEQQPPLGEQGQVVELKALLEQGEVKVGITRFTSTRQ